MAAIKTTALNATAQKDADKAGIKYATQFLNADKAAAGAQLKSMIGLIGHLQDGMRKLAAAGVGADKQYAAALKASFVAALIAGGNSEKTAQMRASSVNAAATLIAAEGDAVATIAGASSLANVASVLSQALAATGIKTRGQAAAEKRAANKKDAAPKDADAAQVDAKGRPVAFEAKDGDKAKATAAVLDGAPTPQMLAQAVRLIAGLVDAFDDALIADQWSEVRDAIESRRKDVAKALKK